MATLIVSPIDPTLDLNDRNNGLIQLNYRLDDLTPGINNIALVGIQLFSNNEILFDLQGITVPDTIVTLSGISSILTDAVENGGADNDSETTHFIVITLNQLNVTDTNNLLLTIPFELTEQFDNTTQVNIQSFAAHNTDLITTLVIPSVTITIADNTDPVLADFTQAGVEDQDIEFGMADFIDRFSDEDNDTLKEIRVITLPTTGELTLAGEAVVADQLIPQAELDNLRYTPATNANGIAVATLDVKAIDSRGAESVTASIQIDLTAVNDAPSFDLSATNLEKPVGTRETIVDFATNVSAGAANESEQSLNFTVEVVSGEAIFSTLPTLDSEGTLNYELSGIAGTAILQLRLQDNGGTANGGVDTSTPVEISITATETTTLPALIASIGSYTGLLSSGVSFRSTVDGTVDLNAATVAGQTDAVFDNLVGLYEVTNRNGTVAVTNPDGTIEEIAPGEVGYALAALNARVDNFTLRAGATRTTAERIEQVGSAILFNGNLYAPFIIANGGGGSVADFIASEDLNQFNDPAQTASDLVAYFSYQGANPDGAAHLLSYGNGVFGFEDLPANLGISDNDFNDAVFAFSFAAIV